MTKQGPEQCAHFVYQGYWRKRAKADFNIDSFESQKVNEKKRVHSDTRMDVEMRWIKLNSPRNKISKCRSTGKKYGIWIPAYRFIHVKFMAQGTTTNVKAYCEAPRRLPEVITRKRSGSPNARLRPSARRSNRAHCSWDTEGVAGSSQGASGTSLCFFLDFHLRTGVCLVFWNNG